MASPANRSGGAADCRPGRCGIPFEAGETILSGSPAPLEPVQAGDRMRLELQGVGEASLSFC